MGKVSGFCIPWLVVPFSEIGLQDKARFMNKVRSLPFRELYLYDFEFYQHFLYLYCFHWLKCNIPGMDNT